MPSHEIVDTKSDSKRATRRLTRERFISVDAEGVNMGKTGPLTLVQIGTEAGHVFLFDVMRTPDMFNEGGLKKLLESESVLKVMHSGRCDGEALYWQFGVELRGVFDTQVAQMVLDKAEGRRYPSRQKLTDVVTLYCPEKSTGDDKVSMKTKFNKVDGEFWAKRPLSPEMIEYAANDVLMLIPEVYEQLRMQLEKKGLMDSFNATVQEEILSRRDSTVSNQLYEETHEMVKAVLLDFGTSPQRPRKFADITDEDVLISLKILRLDDIPKMGLPASIADLKTQQIKAKLDEIENGLSTQGEDFEVSSSICGMLKAWSRTAPNQALKDQAAELLSEVQDVVLVDIQRKYTASSPIIHLTRYEQNILKRTLRPKGERDPSVPKVCLKLYWRLMLHDLEDTIQQYRDDPTGFKIAESYVKKIRFYVSGPVPDDLKDKARSFLDALQRSGKVQRPASSGGRGRGRGRGRGQGRQGQGRQHRY